MTSNRKNRDVICDVMAESEIRPGLFSLRLMPAATTSISHYLQRRENLRPDLCPLDTPIERITSSAIAVKNVYLVSCPGNTNVENFVVALLEVEFPACNDEIGSPDSAATLLPNAGYGSGSSNGLVIPL